MFSAVIIANNESAHIEEVIAAVAQITDDIVVVDSGSTDNTVELARNAGARVYEKNWEGYGVNKNFGNKKAKYNWIISIDGDEVLSQELIQTLQSLRPQTNHVYQLNSLVNYCGKWIRHCGWYPRYKKRIFNKQEVSWNHAQVHEDLEPLSGKKLVKLTGDIWHYSYDSFPDHYQKIINYARLKAARDIQYGKSPSAWKRIFGPAFNFFKTYILKLGFLDGKEGKQIALMDALMTKLQVKYYDQLIKEQK